MNWLAVGGMALLFFAVATPVLADTEVGFVRPAQVALVGQPVELAVEIRYEAGVTPDLFSFGARPRSRGWICGRFLIEGGLLLRPSQGCGMTTISGAFFAFSAPAIIESGKRRSPPS